MTLSGLSLIESIVEGWKCDVMSGFHQFFMAIRIKTVPDEINVHLLDKSVQFQISKLYVIVKSYDDPVILFVMAKIQYPVSGFQRLDVITGQIKNMKFGRIRLFSKVLPSGIGCNYSIVAKGDFTIMVNFV